jgi:hypothetical protein
MFGCSREIDYLCLFSVWYRVRVRVCSQFKVLSPLEFRSPADSRFQQI